MSGFRGDEDESFDDLLTAPTLASSTYAFQDDPQDEDLASNPFADMQSSTAQIPAYSPSPFATTSYETTSNVQEVLNSPAAISSSSYDEPRTFMRESAPEPETPAFSRTAAASPSVGYDYSPYGNNAESPSATPQSPFQSAYSPPSLAHQSAFASPPISPTRTTSMFEASPFAPRAPKPDLTDLLGEEKPILPQFNKRREQPEGVAGPLGSKIAVLPVSSIGKRSVGKPLAALLGLEVEEDEPEPAKALTQTNPPEHGTDQASLATSSEATTNTHTERASSAIGTATSTAGTEMATAPEILDADSGKIGKAVNPVLTALETPLPPSPMESPPATPSGTLTPARAPDLSRASSRADSMLSVESSEATTAYDALVSPMETEEVQSAPFAGEQNLDAVQGLEQKLEALQVTTEGEQGTPKASSLPTPTETSKQELPASSEVAQSETGGPHVPSVGTVTDDPFAQYTFSQTSSSGGRPLRSQNGSVDEAVRDNDVDSIRGTYTRSVEVSEGGDDGADSLQASSATETERHVTSPPLPPVPTMPSPVVPQTSPRSAAMGGSLGPSFIITVEDPHKIGSSLNPASQHTVYTVHTRVSAW